MFVSKIDYGRKVDIGRGTPYGRPGPHRSHCHPQRFRKKNFSNFQNFGCSTWNIKPNVPRKHRRPLLHHQPLNKAEAALKKAGILSSTAEDHKAWFNEGKRLPLPKDLEKMVLHVLSLCCYGSQDLQSVRDWLKTYDFGEKTNLSWDQVVIYRVFCVWLDLFDGFRDFVKADIDELRRWQRDGERELFSSLEEGRRKMALKLIGLYHLASAAECLDGGDRVKFDFHIRASASVFPDVEWGHLVHWLHAASRVLVEEVVS